MHELVPCFNPRSPRRRSATQACADSSIGRELFQSSLPPKEERNACVWFECRKYASFNPRSPRRRSATSVKRSISLLEEERRYSGSSMLHVFQSSLPPKEERNRIGVFAHGAFVFQSSLPPKEERNTNAPTVGATRGCVSILAPPEGGAQPRQTSEPRTRTVSILAPPEGGAQRAGRLRGGRRFNPRSPRRRSATWTAQGGDELVSILAPPEGGAQRNWAT